MPRVHETVQTCAETQANEVLAPGREDAFTQQQQQQQTCSRQEPLVYLKYLECDVHVSQAAAHSALQHLVVVVVRVAQGLLVALQGFLEDAEAQEGVAHAQTHLAVELQAHGGALHVQAGLAVGHRLLEVAQLLVAARQVQVALGQVVRILHVSGRVDLIQGELQRQKPVKHTPGKRQTDPPPPPRNSTKSSLKL